MSATVPMSVRLVDLNKWQAVVTKQAVARADAGGPFVPHHEITEWLESWGDTDEKPAPAAKVRRD